MDDEEFPVTAITNINEIIGAFKSTYDEDSLIEFVLRLDVAVADLSFTKALRDELTEIIRREEEDD